MKKICLLLFLLSMFLPTLAQAKVISNQVSRERILIKTTLGDIVCFLYPGDAPKNSKNFLNLAKLGVFDKTPFTSVNASGILVAGDANYRQEALSELQKKSLQNNQSESNSISHERGVLTILQPVDNEHGINTSFIFLNSEFRELDGKAVVFGQVEKGVEVLDAISGAETNEQNMPIEPIYIEKIQVYDSTELMQKVSLQEAIFLPHKSNKTLFGLMFNWSNGALLLFGLFYAFFANKLPANILKSIGKLMVLVSFFFFYTAFARSAPANKTVATILFASSIAVLFLMTSFESKKSSKK